MATAVSLVSLEYTPTWIVALVCSVIVAISLFMERFLHYFGKFLQRKNQNALFQALQKLKEELMLLGFISLLLTVFQHLISSICIPTNLASHMLPCKKPNSPPSEDHAFTLNKRRLLSTGGDSERCTAQGKIPLLSIEALHQLHIFIFVLGVVHVLFCATTMVLGGIKIQMWKHWEKSITTASGTQGRQNSSERNPSQHHREFIKERGIGFWKMPGALSFTMAFFKQFHNSVTKSDYICLRHGFIMKHCSNPDFDFHKFMMRTLESDFKKVVGISWYLWVFVVLFLLININGWHSYFYLSFLPLILLLIVGAKLEHIITQLAQDSSIDPEKEKEKEKDDEGLTRIKPSDGHFWCHRPRIILYLIHFILFQNSFEIAFFIWIVTTYGFSSCIIESLGYIIPRLVIGVLVQVLCSYITLPLYAIVSQMGDEFKQSMFHEQVRDRLSDWILDVRNRGIPDNSNPRIDCQTINQAETL